MQVQVNRRYSNSFQYGLAYTYSKSFDYANDDSVGRVNGAPLQGVQLRPVRLRPDAHLYRQLHLGCARSSAAASTTISSRALFDNWQISGTTSYASGKPKNITVDLQQQTADITRGQPCPPVHPLDASRQQRARPLHAHHGLHGQPHQRAPLHALRPDAERRRHRPDRDAARHQPRLLRPPTRLGEIGNMPRNAVRSPSTFNTDLAFFKNFRSARSAASNSAGRCTIFSTTRTSAPSTPR